MDRHKNLASALSCAQQAAMHFTRAVLCELRQDGTGLRTCHALSGKYYLQDSLEFLQKWFDDAKETPPTSDADPARSEGEE